MFDGKTWWVTGASSGIGAALAEALSANGARLILSGRNEAALADVAQRCVTPSLILPFEATDYARLPGIIAQAWAWAAHHGGGVHGLVNNAGISQRSLAPETKLEVYERIIAVDLLAPIALTQALLPRMIEAGGGHVVGIASVAGIVGAPLRAGYSAAKAGLIAYHDSLRADTTHQGMRVLVVSPGSVRTNVSRNALDGDAKVRGFSDKVVDNGLAPEIAAQRIIDALVAGQRELILAEGRELQIALMRRSDPEQLFDLMAQAVASGYAQKLGADD